MKLTLGSKLLASSMSGVLVTLVMLGGMVLFQQNQLNADVLVNLESESTKQCELIAEGFLATLRQAYQAGVGVNDSEPLKQEIAKIQVGKTGYAYVLGGSGEQEGDYIVSKGRSRDGENIWGAKDADGRLFIQDIIKSAKAAPEGKSVIVRYPWQNKGEIRPRMKMAACVYFAPYDWVIGASAYEDDFAVVQQKITKGQQALLISVFGGGLVILVLCGGATSLLSRRIVAPIRQAVKVAEAMVAGDFSVSLKSDNRDEIGVLMTALNTLRESFVEMFGSINQSVETLAQSSDELHTASEQMANGATETSSKATTVAAAAEEMSSNMNTVAAAMEQASTNINTVATASEQMTSAINEIAQNTERATAITGEAVHEAQSASTKINELGAAAEEIGKVTETITEISEQTNLLALNATIEAARAGDAGKGFAVVANEIKDLANQTALATEEIRSKINGIQSSTGTTVQEIEKITRIISEVNDIVATIASAVEEQSVTTREIAGNVNQASSGVQEVNENVAQTSAVAGEIAREIADVNTSAGTMNENTNYINQSASKLRELAGQLQRTVARFQTH